MKNFLLILTCAFVVFSCADEPTYEDDSPERTAETDSQSNLSINFDCAETGEVADSTALRTLYFLYGENKVAIDNLPVCTGIRRSDWGALGIPKTAFVASGGKWASGSAYYYVELDGEYLKVSKIISDELDGETGAATEVYRVKMLQ